MHAPLVDDVVVLVVVCCRCCRRLVVDVVQLLVAPSTQVVGILFPLPAGLLASLGRTSECSTLRARALASSPVSFPPNFFFLSLVVGNGLLKIDHGRHSVP